MGRVSGDKSRYNRERRKKIARREQMRALSKTWSAQSAPTSKTKDSAPR
jgi:hypothetical protein